MQRLHFTIAQEDRLLQCILQHLLHSTLRLRDTLLQAHDIHLPRLRFRQRRLDIALSRLRSAQRLHVILRQLEVHPSTLLLPDVRILYSGLLFSLTFFLLDSPSKFWCTCCEFANLNSTSAIYLISL